MKRELIVSLGLVTLLAVLSSADARAQGPLEPSAVPPPGHPAMQQGALREQDDDPGQGEPQGSGGGDGMPEVPQDGVMDDATAAPGSISLQVADPTGKPLPHIEVTLGILYNSIAKGDSRKRISTMADDSGVAHFTGLETGSGVAYRPMVIKDGATFSVSPFALGPKGGMRGILHVYPVTSDLRQARLASQCIVYVEVKDDRVQIQQVFTIYNIGATAWVPKDFIIPLAEGFTAFAAQQAMTDVGVDAVPEKGIKLHGTFGPGQHSIEFKWQVPYAGDSEVKFDVGMAPNLAAARVIAPASKGMELEVDGFDKPHLSTDGAGQRALVTEKRVDPRSPMASLKVTIKGLPTEGSGKILASMLALGGIVMGVVLGSRKAPARDTKRERRQLLGALEALEVAHRDGSIGPKTYERGRRELVDDIARTFAAEPRKASVKTTKVTRKKRA